MPPSLLSPAPPWNPLGYLASLLAGGTLTRNEALRSLIARMVLLSRDDLARSAKARGWITPRELGSLGRDAIVGRITDGCRAHLGLDATRSSRKHTEGSPLDTGKTVSRLPRAPKSWIEDNQRSSEENAE